MKLGKISTISSDVSKKQCIVYTYTFIKSNRTEQYHSEKNINYNHSSHIYNEYDDDFDQQLEKWSVEKFYSDEPEPFKR